MNTKVISILFLLLLIALTLPIQACQQDSPNTLKVTSLEVKPTSILTGENANIKAEVKNDGDTIKKFDIPLMVGGVAENRKYVTLAPGGAETIEFALRRDKEGAYNIQIGEKQATLEVRKPIPATFKLSKLEINPPEPDINSKVIIKADIANVGEVQGKYVAELKINGVVTKTDEMIILPGTSSFFVFTITPSASGIYFINIGELGGQFAIAAPIIPIQIQITPECPPDQKWDTKKKC